jgi:hypothetical protein
MAITDPSLGTLSLLPAEVRSMIWKHVSFGLFGRRSLPRKPSYLSLDQELLLTSRKIYAELSAEIPSGYNGQTINLHVDP